VRTPCGILVLGGRLRREIIEFHSTVSRHGNVQASLHCSSGLTKKFKNLIQKLFALRAEIKLQIYLIILIFWDVRLKAYFFQRPYGRKLLKIKFKINQNSFLRIHGHSW